MHCDSCSGQNKNKYVMWYFCWKVLNSYHKSVGINFMVLGHTKFAPDQCFGLIKQRFQRTEANCLQDIANVVNQSSVGNTAQLVGSEDQTSEVVC